MIQLRFILIAAIGGLTVGCASNQYPVTIASNPPGAEVYCNGQSFGYAPVTRYFELDEATKKSGHLRTCQWQLQWVSGATATVNNVYDLKRFPNGVVWTTPRPNAPNAHVDHQFALQLQQMNYQRRQAQAAEQSAYEQQRQNNKTTTCITNYGFTTCH